MSLDPTAQAPSDTVTPRCDATHVGRHWALRCSLPAGHDGHHMQRDEVNGGWMGSWSDE